MSFTEIETLFLPFLFLHFFIISEGLAFDIAGFEHKIEKPAVVRIRQTKQEGS